MLGKTSGFASLVKKEVPHIIVTHCFLQGHLLTSKTRIKKIINFKRNFFYFCEGRRLCQSSSFRPSYIQKSFVKKWVRNIKIFVSYRSSLAFEKSSFEAFDGTEKGSFIFLWKK